jgi:predicted acylesterase/phospholipase RssA
MGCRPRDGRELVTLELFRGVALTKWIDDLLAQKLKSPTRLEFRQLPNAVRIYACKRDIDALIFDSVKRPEMPVAYAVRCSVAIPFFFTPERHEGLRVVDGGMRHNYPVAKLLEETPGKKFIGLYLGDPIYQGGEHTLISDLISIGTEVNDKEALKKYLSDTIIIDPKPISTLDFSLSNDEKAFLVCQGRAAALTFLSEKGFIPHEEAAEAVKRAAAYKETVIKTRDRRRRKRRRWFSALCLPVAGLWAASWWYFTDTWSLQNCAREEETAQQAFREDSSSLLGTKTLVDCHNPAGYALLRAQAFYRNDYRGAEANYSTAIGHVPWRERTDRWLLWKDSLASIQIETGKYPEAISTFKELVEMEPNSDEFKWDLGKASL